MSAHINTRQVKYLEIMKKIWVEALERAWRREREVGTTKKADTAYLAGQEGW